MGSEQSHHSSISGGNVNDGNRGLNSRGQNQLSQISNVKKQFPDIDSRPVSPPISVCSDSDLPYISYTDRPIGDSPKIRNKGPSGSRSGRSNSISSSTARKSVIKTKQRPSSASHNIVVVKAGIKDPGFERDADVIKIQNIPIFLPVMRSTLSLPANRDPEILERLQPTHLHNICTRMQIHYNVCASQVASDQNQIVHKIKEVDQRINKLFATYVEKQKAYAYYAEHFSKIRSISQQLSRCNTLLNQNIESLELLNNFLDIDERLEPFIWKTNE